MTRRKMGIHRLYSGDPEQADRLLWGRETKAVSRRGFLSGAGYAAMTAAVGAAIPFADLMPGGLIPAALAQSDEPFEIPGPEKIKGILADSSCKLSFCQKSCSPM